MECYFLHEAICTLFRKGKRGCKFWVWTGKEYKCTATKDDLIDVDKEGLEDIF